MMLPLEFPDDLVPPRPLSVWELTAQVKDLVEAAFPGVWVTGEISNFSRPQSGHCYLTLKDDRAQLRAAMSRPSPRGSASICTTAWKSSAKAASRSTPRAALIN